MNRIVPIAAFAAVLARTQAVQAQGPPHEPTNNCAGQLDAKGVVRCALATSPELRQATEQLAAATARRVSAGLWLPSNPFVAATLSQRRRPAPDNTKVLNWSVTLSQTLEVAGQRGLRLNAVEAEVAAQMRRVGLAQQDVAGDVLVAFFDAIAARESLGFAQELSGIAQALRSLVKGRASASVMSGVEADVTLAESIRLAAKTFEAERRLTESLANLAIPLGLTPAAVVIPEVLVPPGPVGLDDASAERDALLLRGEVAAAQTETKILEARLAVVRRERMPNPTISAFAERGEIDDRIFGVGLSVPLPLPAPVGRSRAGEIAEALAQIRAAGSSLELVRRRVRAEVIGALAVYRSKEAAGALFDRDLLLRARRDLASIRESVLINQLPLRQALVWQRSLVELLEADIEARRDRAVAWVQLHRVTGKLLTTVLGDSL